MRISVQLLACPALLLRALLLTALLRPTLLLAQQPSAPPPSAPPPSAPLTLHANARLVVIDVVVTGHDHHPIHHLQQQDFTILENHQPQAIKSFEEHTPLTAAKLPPLPPMPPGTFSNYTPTPPNSALNILLIDTLNTGWTSQIFLRTHVLKYLANAQPGANIAIFGLSTHLEMLQGFTADPELLKAAALKLTGKASPLLEDPVNGGVHKTAAEDKAETGASELPTGLLQTFLDVQNSVTDTARARDTLDAMNLLAHYLSAFPGRKNLIWVSGGFPLNVSPDATNPTMDPFVGIASSEQEYRDTIRLFANSQIAVYPIDARGLSIGSRSVRKDMELADPHLTMMQMAYDTGGRAFLNNNALGEAVNTAVEDGSSYYTIAYRPSDPSENGKFRKTEVKLARQGYLLEYRHGYYEDEKPSANPANLASSPANQARPLVIRAMIHGAPASSEILFKARVLPTVPTPQAQHRALAPAGSLGRYAVDFAVLPSDFSYTTTPDGIRHFNIEFITIAYRPDGSIANRAATGLRGSLTPAQYAALQQNGFPCHQEIDVPVKASISLRLGVHDRLADRIGTIELPLAGVQNLPPATTVETSSPAPTPPSAAPPQAPPN
jgi:VWFA-related protein